MKCQATTPTPNCPNEGTVPVPYLTGERMVCPACARYAEDCSKALEPIDREIIREMQIAAGMEPMPEESQPDLKIRPKVLSLNEPIRTLGDEESPNREFSEIYSGQMNAHQMASLRQSVQRLATAVVEKEVAFGMRIGDIPWDAGCSAGDLSWPKDRTLAALDPEDLVKVIDHVAEYVGRDSEARESQAGAVCPHCDYRPIQGYDKDDCKCPRCGKSISVEVHDGS